MSAAEGPLVVGVDSSTQSTKALVVDAATGRVVASGQAPHTVSSGAGRESDPRQWWDALCEALRQCGDAAHEAAAVSVGGQQHGLVTLDDRGEPLRPALLWNDVRSAPQARRLTEDLGGAKYWAERTGSVPAASFTVTKWAWLAEHEPEAVRATKAVRLPHDYLTERLTGQGTTDRGDVSGTGWWASGTESYDEEILAHVGLDPALLPRVVRPGEVAGTVHSHDLPFSKGTLVAPGTGDNAAAALGLGLRPGVPVMSLGTSGTVYAVSRHRPADPSGTVAGFADARGDWLPLACTLNCTLAVDRVATLLGLDRDAVEPGTAVTLLPYLDGERTPNLPNASGLLHGLHHDTTGGQLLQAAYDGAVHSLLGALDLVLDQDADPSAPLLLIGGGARGAAWQQTVRRLSGRPVQVPEAKELVALGAAAQAAGLLTGEDAAAVARRWDTAAGPVLDAVERDEETLARIAGVLSDAAPLLERPTDTH
ncbi:MULTISPECIES: xylulokinase [Streptomyces]|uniref:Xylulose kinase n=1 Tax=Streptomyces koelreuteriae TaxID=2838015 RepID=A0ABX8G0U1_9ACTN|nr:MULTISPECIES: xylulokinase [Streptomyces]QWB27125.1 xylulokinase [Streptomyces koelreuteriae]UUA10205.1 xylulokinase [Streptomyces koelreuteriae]UUA17811.1 xylulokinase [Streptomyces sp. CRCS-T-1]